MQAFSKGALRPLFVCAATLCAAATQPAVLEKPATPVQTVPKPGLLSPLPPAVIDNTLQIGGADIAARKVDTRMTVAVEVEGRGPFRFVVRTGSDLQNVNSVSNTRLVTIS